MLKARISAKLRSNYKAPWDGLEPTAMAAFERMEEKVLMQEARAQSAAELVQI